MPIPMLQCVRRTRSSATDTTDARVAQYRLHLVARGALEGADHGGGGKVGEQVGDPVGIPAAASLVDRQYKHGDLPASTV